MELIHDKGRERALRYLAREKMAVLSTLAPDGTVDAAAVHFVIDDHFNFYFTTKVGTRKFENMTRDPHVALTTVDHETLETVQLKGNASVVLNMKDIADHIVATIEKNRVEGAPWAPPLSKIDAGQHAIIKVTPSWLRYGAFKDEQPAGEYFTQII